MANERAAAHATPTRSHMKRLVIRIAELAGLLALAGCSHEASPAVRSSAVERNTEASRDADDVPVKGSDLPAPVQATVAAQAHGATIHGLSKSTEDGRLSYELELVMPDGHRKDMDISPAGVVIEVEEVVELSTVPEVARVAIQTRAGTRKVERVEAISKGDGSAIGYEVGVSDGTKRSEFRVGVDGKPLPDDDD